MVNGKPGLAQLSTPILQSPHAQPHNEATQP